jgi:epoxyqueuosine reductase
VAPAVDDVVNPLELSALAKRTAAELGFEACGITTPESSPASAVLDSWLERGFHGEMKYLPRQAHVRRNPSRAWKDARSIVVVLHNYYSESVDSERGYRVAKYAQSADYHVVTKQKLDGLGGRLCAEAGSGSWRSYVDAGPMPERDLALRAGLGWIGKNTMLIRPGLGSFTFIGCLMTDLVLARDEPFEADRCGSCTRCLEACPTDAFVEPRVMDARRCISYLTIESRSEIPEALRPGVGDNLFGCDICQDVCPWNQRFAPETTEPGFRPDATTGWPSTEEILRMDAEAFDARFGRTALERSGLEGLQRNARVLVENRLRVLPGLQPT